MLLKVGGVIPTTSKIGGFVLRPPAAAAHAAVSLTNIKACYIPTIAIVLG